MKPVDFTLFSVFAENSHLQNAVIEYLDHSNLSYHIYFVCNSLKLPDVIEFGFGGSISLRD